METIAIVVAVGFGVGTLTAIVAFVRSCRKPTMKASRSDTDLTNLVSDSLPTGKSPV
jgi:hypothetical protein